MVATKDYHFWQNYALVTMLALIISGGLIAVMALYRENQALRESLNEQAKQATSVQEVNSNYLYLLDKYPKAKNVSARTRIAINVETSHPIKPVSVSLSVDWPGHNDCTLTATAVSILSVATVFLKPKKVICGSKEIQVDGLIFGSEAQLVHGELLTFTRQDGQVVPAIGLAKGTPLDAWLVTR